MLANMQFLLLGTVVLGMMSLLGCDGEFTPIGGNTVDDPIVDAPTPDPTPTPVANCAGCHPSLDSGSAAWRTMSGEHDKHLRLSGVTCGDCHVEVTTDGLTIDNPLLHNNGVPNVALMEPAITFDPINKTCTGPCHGEGHNAEGW